jgi:poly(hydroxyalkanoate) depolymerase family esterase
MNDLFARGMATATRLTQAGKLAEATALIKSLVSGPSVKPDVPADYHRGRSRARVIEGTAEDITPPNGNGRAGQGPASARGDSSAQLEPQRFPAKSLLNRKWARDAKVVPAGTPGDFIPGSFANGAGARSYKLYVPKTRVDGLRPLIVMMHGCTQSPDDFAVGTRMNVCAEEHGCFVVYPEQSTTANASKCWNWFNSSEQQRGQGEPSIIAGLTLELLKSYPIDPRRVYVAGLSAGGAAAAVLGETYPDIYAAVGVHSGLARGAARDMSSAFMAMGGHGKAASHDDGHSDVTFVPTIAFHGNRDRTVHPRNGVDVIARANRSASLQSLTENGGANGRSFTRTVHRDAQGKALSEEWVIQDAGHAWSGGSSKGSYADNSGPDASREMLRFFLDHTLGSNGKIR